LFRQPRPPTCYVVRWVDRLRTAKNRTQLPRTAMAHAPHGSPAPKEEWRRRLAGLRESAEMLRESEQEEHLHGNHSWRRARECSRVWRRQLLKAR
jgi:hypothetical protein